MVKFNCSVTSMAIILHQLGLTCRN